MGTGDEPPRADERRQPLESPRRRSHRPDLAKIRGGHRRWMRPGGTDRRRLRSNLRSVGAVVAERRSPSQATLGAAGGACTSARRLARGHGRRPPGFPGVGGHGDASGVVAADPPSSTSESRVSSRSGTRPEGDGVSSCAIPKVASPASSRSTNRHARRRERGVRRRGSDRRCWATSSIPGADSRSGGARRSPCSPRPRRSPKRRRLRSWFWGVGPWMISHETMASTVVMIAVSTWECLGSPGHGP